MKKLKNQQRQIHTSSTLNPSNQANQDNATPSVFDQAKGQNGMNNMQPYQRDHNHNNLIRISQQQKNLPDFHQMMIPHHEFALHSQNHGKESERVDDLF